MARKLSDNTICSGWIRTAPEAPAETARSTREDSAMGCAISAAVDHGLLGSRGGVGSIGIGADLAAESLRNGGAADHNLDLIPDTGYNIYVQIEGFHKLTGQTSAAYSTPVQTAIVQFNAVTGSESGSVILSFTVDGKDSESWTVLYSAEGEEERSITFPAHTTTLTGLSVGKEYTLSFWMMTVWMPAL